MKGIGWAGVALVGGGLLAAASAFRSRWSRAPVTGSILVMGDSIAVGTGAALSRAGADVVTRAQVGESVLTTSARLTERLAGIPAGATVVVSSGTNNLGGRMDTNEIAAELAAITNDLRAFGYRVVIVGPPPARAWGDAQGSSSWNDALWRLNTTYKRMLDFVDLWELLGAEYRAGYYTEAFGAGDDLHPNRAGYDEIARAILEGRS